MQLMTRVRPDDLSAVEIAALLVLLAPALSRVVGGPAARPGLRVLPMCDDLHPEEPNPT